MGTAGLGLGDNDRAGVSPIGPLGSLDLRNPFPHSHPRTTVNLGLFFHLQTWQPAEGHVSKKSVVDDQHMSLRR